MRHEIRVNVFRARFLALASLGRREVAIDDHVQAARSTTTAVQPRVKPSRVDGRASSWASFKWVLSNPSVSGLVISLWEQAQLDEFRHASGKRPSESDLALLKRYDELVAGVECRPHCGACLNQCPEGLAINDVLRHRTYYEGFGAQKEAMRLYSQLDVKADVCVGCTAPCLAACPDGIPIAQRTREAHRMLTFG